MSSCFNMRRYDFPSDLSVLGTTRSTLFCSDQHFFKDQSQAHLWKVNTEEKR